MLVLTDLEPDDIAMILWLNRIGHSGDLILGKGNVKKKLQWFEALRLKNWNVYEGITLESDEKEVYPDFPPEDVTRTNPSNTHSSSTRSFVQLVKTWTYPSKTLTSETFVQLVKQHEIVVCTKPIDEFLRWVPKDVTFPETRYYGTMSFNFRAAVKDMDPTECAKRMIAMFPRYLLWLESFPAIGTANAGEFEFQHPALRNLQLAWNQSLFNQQLQSLERRVNAEQPDISAIRRSVKCLLQINRDVKRNCLLVDALVVPFLEGKFEPRRVEFKGFDKAGYPIFEPAEQGGLYQAYQTEGLRDYVEKFMRTL